MPLVGSVAFNGKAKATRPGQAGTPSITSQASGQVGISWTAPSFSGGAPITDYTIEYSTNGGSSWTPWSHTPSTATSATVTGLADYLTYIFRVSAVNAVGTGTASGNSANAQQFNAATGGTESTVSNYLGTGQTWKVHTFSSNGTLSVSNSIHIFKAAAIGGGAGGSDGLFYAGAGNVGSKTENPTLSISVGSYSVTRGNGGAGGTNADGAGGGNLGGGGQASSIGALITAAGGAPRNGGGSKNQPGFTGPSTDYSGSTVVAGSSGYGGGDCANGGCPAGAGSPGIVIVAYRIA